MLGGKSAWWKAGWREMLVEKMLGGKRKKKAWLCIMQNMCTDHTQTLSPREPHGISFHYAKHAHRAHPDPKPKGARWGCKTCAHTTPRPQTKWSPMEFIAPLKGQCWIFLVPKSQCSIFLYQKANFDFSCTKKPMLKN